MTLTSIITRTATIALAAAALAAPAASARPADAPSALAKAQHEYSLRASAGDSTGSLHKQARLRTTAPAYPTRPAQGEQANPRPDTPAHVPADRGIGQITISVVVASLLAFAGVVGITRHTRRSGPARITA